METVQESNPLFLILIGIVVLYAILSLIFSWLIQRKSIKHPVRNGFISAVIPGIIFVLTAGMKDLCDPTPGYEGFLFGMSITLSFILFLIIGLPICIISCKKLVKANQTNKE